MNDIKVHYIYMIQLREFIKSGEDIFKIGRSNQHGTQRVAQYPKGSQLMLQRRCVNCHIMEKEVKRMFGVKYNQRKEIGTEYFEGDCNEMIKDINSILDKETSDKLTIEEEEDYSKDEVIDEIFTVKTYDDYCRINGDLFLIVITKKKTCEGYIKFKNSNHLWRKLDSIDKDDTETLEGFLEYNSGNYYANRDVEYDYEQLKTDICKKFYLRYPNFYNLKYHEFVVDRGDSTKVYNIINDSYDSIPTDKILCVPTSSRTLSITDDVLNTNIVEEILNNYVTDYSLLKEFKKLFVRTMVKEYSGTFIFNDYGRSHLTSWLRDVLYTFTDGGILYADEYYKDRKKYTTQIRNKNFRAVYIYSKELNKKNETMIKDFTTLGFKNIVFIKNDEGAKKYDEGKLKVFLKENKQLIEDNFLDKHENYIIDDLFYSPRCLFLHFIRWCG